VSKFQIVVLALICAACAFGFIQIFSEIPAEDVVTGPAFGNVEEVGKLMLSDFLYPFEMISVLLLAAIVGVVLLAKKVI
jgi:NADH-quinone oxidoreductase subunit J